MNQTPQPTRTELDPYPPVTAVVVAITKLAGFTSLILTVVAETIGLALPPRR